jgi:hypothetical protein
MLGKGWKPAHLQTAISLVRARSALEMLCQPGAPRAHLAAEERRALIIVLDAALEHSGDESELLGVTRVKLMAEVRADAPEAGALPPTRARTRRSAVPAGRVRRDTA